MKFSTLAESLIVYFVQAALLLTVHLAYCSRWDTWNWFDQDFLNPASSQLWCSIDGVERNVSNWADVLHIVQLGSGGSQN